MRRRFIPAFLLPFLFAGCVELCGQRISIHFDQDRDELHLLLLYDGIHDSGSDEHGEGVEQMREFVRDQDIMLLDWPFHVSMAGIREAAADPDLPKEIRELARITLSSVRSFSAGHYRDPLGRLGAGQLVVISPASSFLAALNRAISRWVLDEHEGDTGADGRLTRERVLAAARSGYQWVSMEGHALRVSVPVHPREWAAVKAEGLGNQLGELISLARKGEDVLPEVERWIQGLAAAPWSLQETEGSVAFRLGVPASPSTFRFSLRDEYGPELEQVVQELLPDDLREGILAAEPGPGARAVRDWGPPEEHAMALLGAVRREARDQEAFRAALSRLDAWARDWNGRQGIPRAPRLPSGAADGGDSTWLGPYLEDWRAWYGSMYRFPLPEE